MHELDIQKLISIKHDRNLFDYRKMKYKYGASFDALLEMLREDPFIVLPILDKDGKNLLVSQPVSISTEAYLSPSGRDMRTGVDMTENEILNTCRIEDIPVSKADVSNIVAGIVPERMEEKTAKGMKLGRDFIKQPENEITEENIYRLYMMSIGDALREDLRPGKGSYYRNDSVVVQDMSTGKIDHAGMNHLLVSEAMRRLVEFINDDSDGIDYLVKGAAIHFYIAYVHPYFDGNGRMARLIHLWYLYRVGFKGIFSIPFSQYIHEAKNEYYKAFISCEENRRIAGFLDIYPFLYFFSHRVYARFGHGNPANGDYRIFFATGQVTQKEDELWKYINEHFREEAFSTKQLEKRYGKAAYRTIRSFVGKFEKEGLLEKINYSSRPKYRLAE